LSASVALAGETFHSPLKVLQPKVETEERHSKSRRVFHQL